VFLGVPTTAGSPDGILAGSRTVERDGIPDHHISKRCYGWPNVQRGSVLIWPQLSPSFMPLDRAAGKKETK
jgi:hypothetical protein